MEPEYTRVGWWSPAGDRLNVIFIEVLGSTIGWCKNAGVASDVVRDVRDPGCKKKYHRLIKRIGSVAKLSLSQESVKSRVIARTAVSSNWRVKFDCFSSKVLKKIPTQLFPRERYPLASVALIVVNLGIYGGESPEDHKRKGQNVDIGRLYDKTVRSTQRANANEDADIDLPSSCMHDIFFEQY